jgi:hypothetical protein
MWQGRKTGKKNRVGTGKGTKSDGRGKRSMSTGAMNRAQRRAQKRNERKVKPVFNYTNSAEERLTRIQKNGITIDDLERAYKDGAQDGQKRAIKMAYARFLLGLNKEYGFGKKRAVRALKAADDAIVYALDTEEMMDEVYRKFCLTLDFNESGMESRVKEAAE